MDANQFAKMSSKDRIAYIQSVTGKSPQQIVTQYGMNLNAGVGTKGFNDLMSKLQPTFQSGGGGTAAPYKTDSEKAREAAAAQEADYVQKAREQIEKTPGFETILKGSEWDKYYNEAQGTGPMAAYEALRKQEEARRLGEESRLGMRLQDELQNVDVGRAGQLSNAYSGLAMGGGLSSGARERIGAGSLEQAMAQRQAGRLQNQRSLFDLGQKSNEAMLGFGTQEAQARQQMQADIMKQKQAEELRRQQMAADLAKQRQEFEINQLKAGQLNKIGGQ